MIDNFAGDGNDWPHRDWALRRELYNLGFERDWPDEN